MITLISTIFGVLSGLLPNIIKIFEKKLDYKHEIELTKIKMDAAREGLVLQLQVEGLKADASEGESLRKHDSDIEYTGFWGALRASIRPTITYAFFILFCGIKIAAFIVLVDKGATPTELLTLVWDNETMAIFSAIIGFWFGSRAIEKFSNFYTGTTFSLQTNQGVSAATISAAKTVSVPAKKVAPKKRPARAGRDK
jgi:hypothetical protein